MSKRVLGMFLVAAVVALPGATAVFAQAANATARIPFSFVAGSAVLPAGSYTVRPDSQDGSVLWIVSADGRHGAAIATNWKGTEARGNEALFEFRKYGDTYVLSEVAIPGESVREVPLSRQQIEHDLAKAAAQRYARHANNG